MGLMRYYCPTIIWNLNRDSNKKLRSGKRKIPGRNGLSLLSLLILPAMFLGVTTGDTYGQYINNNRLTSVAEVTDTVHFDSLSTIPSSLRIRDAEGYLLNDSTYWIDYANSLLVFFDHPEKVKTPVQLTYRVFPLMFTTERSHKSTSLLTPDPSGLTDPFVYTFK